MFRTPFVIAASIATLFASSATVFGQSAASGGPRVIVVKLVVKGGSVPYAFEPANITAERGDTIRFVNEEAVPHDVHFKTHPGGSKLGAASLGPYLTAKGQTYDVVIDARFTDGKYDFVCDPHETIGMHGILTINGRVVAASGTK